MKTSVEISGYLITIEEVDGVISVNAAKDDEVVEEFTISVQESDDEFAEEGGEEGGEMGDVKPFGDYDEEEDFGDEEDDIQDQIDEEPENDEIQSDDDDDDDDDDNDDDNDDELSLESFQAFINKKPASKRK